MPRTSACRGALHWQPDSKWDSGSDRDPGRRPVLVSYCAPRRANRPAGLFPAQGPRWSGSFRRTVAHKTAKSKSTARQQPRRHLPPARLEPSGHVAPPGRDTVTGRARLSVDSLLGVGVGWVSESDSHNTPGPPAAPARRARLGSYRPAGIYTSAGGPGRIHRQLDETCPVPSGCGGGRAERGYCRCRYRQAIVTLGAGWAGGS